MGSKKPSIKQLEYFVTVAGSSNFRKAAAKLGISQPTLTSQIGALEETLGVQLFERSRAGTLLSPKGRELLAPARELLEQYQSLLDLTHAGEREMEGTYKIGVDPTMGPYLLSNVLPILHKRYPGLKLHIREEHPKALEAGLNQGIFDLILTVLPMHSTENRVRPLFEENLKVVVSGSHPMADKEDVSLQELQNQTVLVPDDIFHLHRQTLMLCEKSGAKIQRDFEANSLASLMHMVMMNMGMAFLPELFLSMEIRQDSGLKVLSLNNEAIVRNHVAAWRINASSRQLFQKLSYDIKVIAMEKFPGILKEVVTEENL